MTSIEEKKYFNDETTQYLLNSFKKANFSEENFSQLMTWLSSVPKWTTIRVNKCVVDDLEMAQSLEYVQDYVSKAYVEVGELSGAKNTVPKCSFLNDLIKECVIFNCSQSKLEEGLIKKFEKKKVIIDVKCAQAILRGADLFVPGIIGLSLYARAKDEVSIYADLSMKCLKGSDANLYLANTQYNVQFIGNGVLMLDRDEIFKHSNQKSGVGVKIVSLKDNYYIPSFDQIDQSKFYLQNLPSLICGKVLDPKENETILDMCAAPGGKTSHLAALVNNKSRIIAFDKISSKIKKMKEFCEALNAKCVECYCQDVTKIDFNIYKPESFDRILVDAPCSALGQRPLIFNQISLNQLIAYPNYQKNILDIAVKLLKPGGYLVYSTCTITIEENEEQVSWLLKKYPNLNLVDQSPYNFAESGGLKCANGLSDEQLKKLQRFMPNFSINTEHDLNSVFNDSNGFFIAKFYKKLQ